MKKKILILVFIVLIFLIILICNTLPRKKNTSNKNETSRNFILQDNTTKKVNTHGENTGIYVGVNENGNENYLFISVKIDKKASIENQIESLISEIGEATGYTIKLNSIEKNDSKIKIDFSKDGAPFETEKSYSQTNSQKYFITSDYAIAKVLFDSINKTLTSYFGENTEVYFSANQENINITNEILSINIDKNIAY